MYQGTNSPSSPLPTCESSWLQCIENEATCCPYSPCWGKVSKRVHRPGSKQRRSYVHIEMAISPRPSYDANLTIGIITLTYQRHSRRSKGPYLTKKTHSLYKLSCRKEAYLVTYSEAKSRRQQPNPRWHHYFHHPLSLPSRQQREKSPFPGQSSPSHPSP